MKSKSIFASLLFSSVLFFGCEKEEVVADTDLPTAAKEFISLHFVAETITTVKKEKDLLEKNANYEVTLGNGTSLDFDEDGTILEVDGNQTALPASLIPAKIGQYVQTTYPNALIVGWEQEGENQDIDLSTNEELRFDKNNEFVGLQ
jgi:hypothetical protein